MRCKKMMMHMTADRRERIRRTSSRGPEISNIQFAVRPRRNLRIGPLWYMEDESKRSIYLSLSHIVREHKSCQNSSFRKARRVRYCRRDQGDASCGGQLFGGFCETRNLKPRPSVGRGYRMSSHGGNWDMHCWHKNACNLMTQNLQPRGIQHAKLYFIIEQGAGR